MLQLNKPGKCPIAPTQGIDLLEGAGSAWDSTYPLRSPSSGYAAEVILRSRVQSLVLGAPRYQHTGLVVMFRENAGVWETNTVIKGSQVSAEHVVHECTNRGILGAERFQDRHLQVPHMAVL